MTLPIDARVSSADAAPAPLDAPTAIPDAQPGNPDAGVVARCGNGIVEASEQCDDGNSSNIDSCTTTCLSTIVTSADDSGPGTLRALALAVPDGTRLTFDVSLSGKTILLTSPIALPSNLAIVGLGAQQLTIDGGGANQILTPAATLSISGLTLQHGLATSLTGGPSLGAAIGCSTELHVDGCAFNANLANNGGALCISGPATISNSSFDSNSSEFGGGAIFMNGHGTTTTISNTTIANSTSPQGSAINVNGGTLSMTNSTIANSSGDSGTILNIDTTELAFVTVTGSTGYPALYNAGNAFSIKNSIVANNPAGDFVGFSAIESGDYNVIDNDGAIVSTQGHDAIGGTTALSDLADNGGTGKTQSITVDSAAFDSIPAPLCTDWSGASVSTDERGAARPVDATCDAGAFERQATDVPLPDCGNGTREVGEECDDGVSNDNNGACLLTCKVARCGDGFIESNVEICDDGSNGPGTCCAADCGGDLTCSLNQSNPTTGAIAGGIIWNGLPAAGNSLFMLSLPNGTGDTITNGSYAFGSLAPATYHLELCSSGNEAPTLVQSDVEVTA